MPHDNISLLKSKATKLNINLRQASDSTLFYVYRETLTDLDAYLDTGDLAKLSRESIEMIRDDVLSLISGLHSIGSNHNKFDPTLIELKRARDELRIALGAFGLHTQSAEVFFSSMRNSKKSLDNAISLLPDTQELSQLFGDTTTEAPPPDVKKKKRKGK